MPSPLRFAKYAACLGLLVLIIISGVSLRRELRKFSDGVAVTPFAVKTAERYGLGRCEVISSDGPSVHDGASYTVILQGHAPVASVWVTAAPDAARDGWRVVAVSTLDRAGIRQEVLPPGH